MVMGYTYNWFDLFLFKQKTAYEMRISDWSSDGALPIYGRQPRPAAGHRVHGACVERATTGGAGVLVRTGTAGAQAAAVPAIRHAVNAGDGGAARRVLAVLSGLGPIGRAHDLTPATNAHLVYRLLIYKQKSTASTHALP